MNQSIKIDPYGFREYDARWVYKKDINIEGIINLGKGLGTQIKKHTKKENPRVTANDLKRGEESSILNRIYQANKTCLCQDCYSHHNN